MQSPFSAVMPPSRPRRLRVIRSYGYVGGGVSQAQYVLAENGQEYIVKGPSLAPHEPWVAVNELLSAMIGGALGLPMLDSLVVEMGGDLLFGSAWMQPGTFDPAVTPATLLQCENLDRIYDLVVFDAWLCNEDRHDQNLLVRRRPQRGSPDLLFMLLNDHSRCLLPPGLNPAMMAAHWLGTSPDRYIRLDYVRGHVTDRDALGRAIDAVERMDEDLIRTLVRSLPDVWLTAAEGTHIADFLIARRDELRTVFNGSAREFPALQGALL